MFRPLFWSFTGFPDRLLVCTPRYCFSGYFCSCWGGGPPKPISVSSDKRNVAGSSQEVTKVSRG